MGNPKTAYLGNCPVEKKLGRIFSCKLTYVVGGHPNGFVEAIWVMIHFSFGGMNHIISAVYTVSLT